MTVDVSLLRLSRLAGLLRRLRDALLQPIQLLGLGLLAHLALVLLEAGLALFAQRSLARADVLAHGLLSRMCSMCRTIRSYWPARLLNRFGPARPAPLSLAIMRSAACARCAESRPPSSSASRIRYSRSERERMCSGLWVGGFAFGSFIASRPRCGSRSRRHPS